MDEIGTGEVDEFTVGENLWWNGENAAKNGGLWWLDGFELGEDGVVEEGESSTDFFFDLHHPVTRLTYVVCWVGDQIGKLKY